MRVCKNRLGANLMTVGICPMAPVTAKNILMIMVVIIRRRIIIRRIIIIMRRRRRRGRRKEIEDS